MAIVALTHNNKNQYRKYPLKQGALLKTSQGRILSDAVIVNCSITSIYGIHRIFIKQVYYKNNVANITIASAADNTVLGAFTGDVLADFTTLQLTPFTRFVSGNITLGTLQALQTITDTMNFASDVAELEESVIFCYKVPAVRSINDVKKNQLRGYVNFGNLTNLEKTNSINSVLFNVENTEAIKNRYDKSTYLGNCPTPVIRNINGVQPYNTIEGTSTQNDGNVYLAGVKPIVFYGNTEGTSSPGCVGIDTENVTLSSLCAEKYKILPPVDLSGITTSEGDELYYNKTNLLKNAQSTVYPHKIPDRLSANLFSAVYPEYFYWPQFVKREYYDKLRLEAPSAPKVISIAPSNNGAVVHFEPPKNHGALSLIYYSYTVDNGATWQSWRNINDGTYSLSSPLTVSRVLIPNTDYYFMIRAHNSQLSIGTGEESIPIKFTTLA